MFAQILPHLEQFQKIIIWFGADVKAWDAARQFARKLIEKRCFLIRYLFVFDLSCFFYCIQMHWNNVILQVLIMPQVLVFLNKKNQLWGIVMMVYWNLLAWLVNSNNGWQQIFWDCSTEFLLIILYLLMFLVSLANTVTS